MFTQTRSKWAYPALLAVVVAGVLVAALGTARPAQAHCDSEQGPVATAAHQALEKGDVRHILPYVKPEAENELIAAFKQSLAVRKSGGEAEKLADWYFIETAIRLHRAGEGAPYTGVTDESTPRAILIADQAMATGSLEAVNLLLGQAIKSGLDEKYAAVAKARKEAEKLGTVEAHRERVEAELLFEKYVYEIFTLASSELPHAEVQNH